MLFHEFDDHIQETNHYFDQYGEEIARWIIFGGLCEEVGEAHGKMKKTYRDAGGIFTAERVEMILAELGDSLWYLTAAAQSLGSSLVEVAEMNLAKVRDRHARGVVHGNGDTR